MRHRTLRKPRGGPKSRVYRCVSRRAILYLRRVDSAAVYNALATLRESDELWTWSLDTAIHLTAGREYELVFRGKNNLRDGAIQSKEIIFI